MENTFQGPTSIRGSLYNITHITTVCAHTITVYTTGKQLSVLHVYQGFPPLKQHTYPLCGHTQPLCTLLKNNFQGPMFSRAAPPSSSSQHKQPLCGHTETLCGSSPSEEQSISSPMFIKRAPLSGYLLTVNTPIFAFFYRPS